MGADVVVITVSVLLIGFLGWVFFGPKRASKASVVGVGGGYRCVDASHIP